MRRPRRAYLIAGGLLIGAIVVAMLFAEHLTHVSPHYWDARTSILLGLPPFPPSAMHPLGTDQYGRDIWSRIVYGSRWSMLFAFLIMSARLAVATPAAFLSVFGPKRLGWLVDRLYVMTSAIPPLLIYILILAVPQLRLIGLWPSVVVTVTMLTFMEWPRVAVVLKGRLSSLMAEPFVEGAVAVGNTRWQLFKNHLFPHLWPVLLHMVAAEMARALVVIAQLAIFGIMVGGGVINIIMDSRGNDLYTVTSGIPEWGTLLGDGRYDILSHPWIPFAPAVAFLVGVVGFNLLSQGLETIVFSVQELKEATTARLSARWRWAFVVVPAVAVLWFYQGLPWGREAEIRELAARQAAALTERNVDAYVATLDGDAVADLREWAADLIEADPQAVAVTPAAVQLHGDTALATWQVSVGRRTDPPLKFERRTKLVRRWGRWYEAGENYTHLRGYETDVTAVYDPIDPSAKAIPQRWNVQFVATAADHAYDSVAAFFPAKAGAPRPEVKLYPSIQALQQAVGPKLPEGATVWYESGQPIRMAPDYLKGTKRWDVERSLAYEMMKFLTETRLGQSRVSPMTLGSWDLHQEKGVSIYRIDVTRLAGQRVMTLDELFTLPASELSQQRQYMYAVQSGLLAEYTEARLTERPVAAVDASDLARQLGTTVETLGRDYYAYVLDRIYSESLLTIPAALPRIPAGLAEAVGSRVLTDANVAKYEAKFLDFAEKSGLTTVMVLEQAVLADGRQVSGVVSQVWRQSGTAWVGDRVESVVLN
ncbi:MAG TPA: ABC transporter permease subunit [Symbiobacteriaceae bacterium]|nr:ABC transporter permease subunit [Symbiobacteriaceae bacterium]